MRALTRTTESKTSTIYESVRLICSTEGKCSMAKALVMLLLLLLKVVSVQALHGDNDIMAGL